jgi:hypothetical protein
MARLLGAEASSSFVPAHCAEITGVLLCQVGAPVAKRNAIDPGSQRHHAAAITTSLSEKAGAWAIARSQSSMIPVSWDSGNWLSGC